MLISVVLLSLFAASVFGATIPTTTVRHTHRPHPSHEPAEHSTFTFVYEPTTLKFAISTGSTCYIFNLTPDERIAVHTDTGMKALELKLASLIDVYNKTMTDAEDVNGHIKHACARHTATFYMMSP